MTKQKNNIDEWSEWLQAVGEKRTAALKKAAADLLGEYRRQKNTQGAPINLYRLAALQKIKIVLVKGLSGGGRLLPVTGGFQILIDHTLPERKFRASVAHELAHSLFFARTQSIPTRLFPSNQAEHNFCFDVARHILGPEWLLEEVGVFHATSAVSIFDLLTNSLRISRPLAARLMLEDYKLRTGLADRWIRHGNEWQLDPGTSLVSPSISGSRKREVEIRRWLRSIAIRLLTGKSEGALVESVCSWEKDKDAAFVVITNRRHARDGAN